MSESDPLLDNNRPTTSGRPPDEDTEERLPEFEIIHLATGTYDDCPAYINQPFNTGVLIALTSITIGAALGLAPVLVGNSSGEYARHFPGIVTLSLSAERIVIAIPTMCVSGWMIYHRNRITLRRNDHTSTNDDSKPLIRTLAMFGAGSFVYCIIGLFISMFLHEDIVLFFQYIAHAIFVLCLLLFFLSFRPEHTTFKNLPSVHFSFTFLITVTTWTWIEIVTNHVYGEYEYADVYTKVVDPFYIEFPTIALLVFIGLWTTTISRPANHSLKPRDFIAWSAPSTSEICGTITTSFISVAVVSLYVGTLIISHFFKDDYEYNYSEVYIIVKFIYIIIILCPMMVLAWKLKYWRDSENCPLSASEAVLMLTTCSDVLWYTFALISTTACLTVDKRIISDNTGEALSVNTGEASTWMVCAILSIVQSVVQTKLFIDLRRKGKPLYAKKFLIFFIAFNFSEWLDLGQLIPSLFPPSYESLHTSLIPCLDFFFDGNDTMSLLIGPFRSLFRFHAGMVAIELIQQKNLTKNRGKKHSRRLRSKSL